MNRKLIDSFNKQMDLIRAVHERELRKILRACSVAALQPPMAVHDEDADERKELAEVMRAFVTDIDARNTRRKIPNGTHLRLVYSRDSIVQKPASKAIAAVQACPEDQDCQDTMEESSGGGEHEFQLAMAEHFALIREVHAREMRKISAEASRRSKPPKA